MVLLETPYRDTLPPRITTVSDTKQAVRFVPLHCSPSACADITLHSQFLQLVDQLGLESEIPQEAQNLKEVCICP